MPVDQNRWAAAYYRVEREWSGSVMRKRQRRKATEQAIQQGDTPPGPPQDVVRIYDREGEVVFEQQWGDRRSDALAHEAQIVDDLLHLDVLVFAAKYSITDLPDIPVEPEPEKDAETPAEALDRVDDDPAAEARFGGRSEQGSG